MGPGKVLGHVGGPAKAQAGGAVDECVPQSLGGQGAAMEYKIPGISCYIEKEKRQWEEECFMGTICNLSHQFPH